MSRTQGIAVVLNFAALGRHFLLSPLAAEGEARMTRDSRDRETPETLVQPPARETADPNRPIEVNQTAARAEDRSDQFRPVQPTVPSEDPAKTIVPLVKFSDALVESGLLSREEITTFIESLPVGRRPQNGKQLAQELFRARLLTRFQVHAVYQGKTRGLVVGNYVVLDKLGQGGMGQVYTARHTRMDRVVAIKVLPAAATKSPEAVKRFQREVKAAARLTHPNIVTAYDADEYRGVHFLVMEHVDGQDLASLVREKGSLPVKQAVDCIVQAARGLEYAHRQGVIHRDIKPHNLLLDRQGVVKILDMGLARMEEQIGSQDEGLTHSGAVMGTLDYMAPEQAMDTKTADVRADIYSLGCTLHFLLTCRPPYRGDSLAAKIVAHRLNPLPSLRAEPQEVPEALDQVFRKMLAKRPDERHANMTEVLQDLANVGGDLEVSDAVDVTVATHHRTEDIDLIEAEDLEESPSLDGLSDKSVDLTQRWIAPSVTHASTATSWLSEHKTLAMGAVAVCVVGLLLLLSSDGDPAHNERRSGGGGERTRAQVEVLDAEGQVVVIGTSGDSPLVLLLESGKHRIRIEKDGFVPYSEGVEIVARGTTMVQANLVPRAPDPGTLVLAVSEADALVRLLGEAGNVEATYRSSGAPLSITLAAGTHRLLIEKPGFDEFTTDLTVRAGARTAVTASLEQTAPITGTLLVKVNETDALVELLDTNSTVVGTFRTTEADLTMPNSPLQGRVRVSKEGFETTSRNFVLPASGSTSIDVPLSRTPPPDATEQWNLPTGAPPPAIAPFDSAQAKLHQDAWAKYLKVPAETTNSIGMKLVLIPPGEFDMGSTREEVERLLSESKQRHEEQWDIDRLHHEVPKHRVRITSVFCLGTCEVTAGQFRQFVADTDHVTGKGWNGKGGYGVDASGKWVQKPEWTWRQPGFEQSGNHPVVQVGWNDAVSFCEWLSRKEGKSYRLPTEAEWEYACRAGTATPWQCGDSDATLPEHAWFAVNSHGTTHPAGQLKPSAWGLFDMHGNVWEWCGDCFADGYYKNSPPADPSGPPTGSLRVLRGGGWTAPAAECRSAHRCWYLPPSQGGSLGFRVAAVLSGK